MNSLSGSTLAIIGRSSGIGLETARQAHAAGAKLILTGRDQRPPRRHARHSPRT
jgi:NAD(P)-dependent dehydrogenase (short-subunit alcohol dehydrogenase family)